MNIYICIDDTDMPGTPGTGHLAEDIRLYINAQGWGMTSQISRHQLFVHDAIPYTSHNSAMCFKVEGGAENLDQIRDYAISQIEAKAETGSDPGFCLAVDKKMTEIAALIDFGKRAKFSVLTKEEAYEIARVSSVHLSEHGGTGQGVIGALAGVGLYLSGCDGRIKGKLMLEETTRILSAGELRKICGCDFIVGIDGSPVEAEEAILIAEPKIKMVRMCWKNALPLVKNEGNEAPWRTLKKTEYDMY